MRPLQPPVAKFHKPYVTWGFDLKRNGEHRKRWVDRHSQGRDPKKTIRPVCLLEGKTLRQSHPFTISSRSGLFTRRRQDAVD